MFSQEEPRVNNFVHIQTDDGELVKMEEYESVPLDFHFMQQDDDPSKLENFMAEDLDIPLNMRLVHLSTEEGDVIRIENI